MKKIQQKLWTLRGIKFSNEIDFKKISNNLIWKEYWIDKEKFSIYPRNKDFNKSLIQKINEIFLNRKYFKKGIVVCDKCEIKLYSAASASKKVTSYFRTFPKNAHRLNCEYIKKTNYANISRFSEFEPSKNYKEKFASISFCSNEIVTIKEIDNNIQQVHNLNIEIHKKKNKGRIIIKNLLIFQFSLSFLQEKINPEKKIEENDFETFEYYECKLGEIEVFQKKWKLTLHFTVVAYQKIMNTKQKQTILIGSNGFIDFLNKRRKKDVGALFISREKKCLIDEKNIKII